MQSERRIACEINGTHYEKTVPVRRLLSDFLRDDVGLRGTHVGCEQGVCGACTVLIQGVPMRSCLLLAVQVDGERVETVEGLGTAEHLHPVQAAFHRHHALQCGFCTPGFLMAAVAAYRAGTRAEASAVDSVLDGHLCRCTGYVNIRRAVADALGTPAD